MGQRAAGLVKGPERLYNAADAARGGAAAWKGVGGMSSHVRLLPGDPAPWFHQRTITNPNYAFDTAAGRYIVLCFFGSAADAHAGQALDAARALEHVFDDVTASFFGVSLDPADESTGRVADRYPGYRYFWDFDAKVSRLYGVVPQDVVVGEGPIPVRRLWVVLDPTLRVLEVIPFADDRSDIAALRDRLAGLPPLHRFAGMEMQAPVLLLPNVFDAEFCRRLVSLYDAQGGERSGFMRDIGGKTTGVHDHRHKSRKDCIIQDPALIQETQARIRRSVIPEIHKVHQFMVTRMERYIVACYDAEDGGHFRAHRDNTTKGTAHRRFAVSVFLNDDFDGGEVSFPEYGRKGFRAPVGGAVVFSCSLLHAVSRVTRGRRYVFLPFLYDDAAARIREQNNPHLGEDLRPYQSDAP